MRGQMDINNEVTPKAQALFSCFEKLKVSSRNLVTIKVVFW